MLFVRESSVHPSPGPEQLLCSPGLLSAAAELPFLGGRGKEGEGPEFGGIFPAARFCPVTASINSQRRTMTKAL